MLKEKLLWISYIVALVVFSLSIAIMPLGNSIIKKQWIIYLDASLFWISVLCIMFILITINSARKKNRYFNKKNNIKKGIGIFSFFKNKYAKIADISMLFMVIIYVIQIKVINKNIYSFIILGMWMFSFGMHSMLNGINYKYLKFILKGEKYE